MKLLAVASLAALGGAFVIPDDQFAARIKNDHGDHFHSPPPSWLDRLGSEASVFTGSIENSIASAVDAAHRITPEAIAAVAALAENHLGHRRRNPHEPPDKTIYQLISTSPHTTFFASLLDDHPDLVDVLNTTKANHTLFVPTDEAFKHIPGHHDGGHHEKPPKEVMDRFLRYHIAKGTFGLHALCKAHTLPTLLDEELLGGEPQRLRTRVGLRGINVNAYSTVLGGVPATNGLVHGIDRILVPPLLIGKEVSLLPSQFSTLLHAYQKTDFVSFIHSVPMRGSTVVAPTNAAFARLGLRANAFLFETEKGRSVLKALLKYQIVVNTTLYSDAIYEHRPDALGDDDYHGARWGKNAHYDLHTLLDGAVLAADVHASWAGFVSVRFNRHVPVVFQDLVAKNGVVQVVGRLPLPPCRHKKEEGGAVFAEDEISVEELVERMTPYLEEGRVEEPEGFTDL